MAYSSEFRSIGVAGPAPKLAGYKKENPAEAGFSITTAVKNNQLRSLIITPAATAEPITPATFGPIACISRKFCGLASRPTLLDTRAAIGTADTPAEPINGLIGSLVTAFISLAIRTPAAVPIQNATRPSTIMARVLPFRKASELIL